MVMGNVSGRRDGAGPSGVKKSEEGEQYMDFAEGMAHVSYHGPGLFPQTTVQPPPPHSPMAFLSPLMFTQQVPVVALPDEMMHSQSNASMPDTTEYEYVPCEQRIPTMITWSHGGNQVAVEGSWDNWRTREALQKSGEHFIIMKMLTSGVYRYRFIVDGQWRYDQNLPRTQDDMGHVHNILDLQDYVPDAVASRSAFESPPSPESSYNNFLDTSFYEKDPPLLPPQLRMTPLNVPPSSTDQSSPRPHHSILDHLYIQEDSHDHSVVALGSTHRFREKYVTVELYRSIQRFKK
ncbi:hypothetical protein L1049_025131 [Liquidambar formosana]|uniref:Association with the SNF1 complex (ASC) domain-containing protein n=1 Tax=Liquidambar formosana TaxID=63359 RepID=A0AAP0RX43_LIQFO